jgi:hypothetical protein
MPNDRARRALADLSARSRRADSALELAFAFTFAIATAVATAIATDRLAAR